MKVYRSELFVFMYVLIVFWAVLSVALLYAIYAESHCIYAFWIWYTMVFGVVMAGLMFLLFCGFCVLAMRRKSIVALLACIYYLVTLYFVVVVNKQRKEVFGLAATCGSCAIKHVFPNAEVEQTHDKHTPMSTTVYTMHPTMRTDNYVHETTTTPTTLTTTVTTTTLTTTTSAEARREMSPAMAALLAGGGDDEDNESSHTDRPPRIWTEGIRPEPEQVWTTDTPSDRVEAIARLSELLINSNECRKPRKPAHGRFQSSGRRSAMLKLTLHCDPGYRESSVATQCKYNWWDRPIPQCRKRKPPGPLPLPGGGCLLPGYPAHGEYRVADHARARPGDRVAGDNVVLLVTCDEPYRAVDPYVICVEGRWRHGPPSCLKHCKLVFDPTVDYRCLKAFKDEFLACSTWQPDGAVVAAACRPGHAHRGPFRYMRCRGNDWDHVVSCVPNANFTSS
ncbi:uncharacterized protein LOC133532685 isoform X2 [Cydia pomonella]|nr:uncharacterized protein LOC133532685 isoform X2 [Cydia pomonella]